MIGWKGGALAALLCLPGVAHANVIYDWVSPDLEPHSNRQLVVSDQAYASGRLTFSLNRCGGASGCASTTGDPSGFIGFPFATPQWGSLIVDLTFNPGGTIDGTFHESGSNITFLVAGAGLDWSGTYSADASAACIWQHPCPVSGYFMLEGAALTTLAAYTTVPEPNSIALLLASLALLTLFTRRKETI